MRWSGRLDAFEGPASAAAWLQEPGLLTERLRACCSGRSGLTVVAEYDATISVADAALGARLAAIPGIVRGPLEFTLLCAPSALYRRALCRRDDPPPTLWARRSWYEMDGDRLMVQEVFLPEALA